MPLTKRELENCTAPPGAGNDAPFAFTITIAEKITGCPASAGLEELVTVTLVEKEAGVVRSSILWSATAVSNEARRTVPESRNPESSVMRGMGSSSLG